MVQELKQHRGNPLMRVLGQLTRPTRDVLEGRHRRRVGQLPVARLAPAAGGQARPGRPGKRRGGRRDERVSELQEPGKCKTGHGEDGRWNHVFPLYLFSPGLFVAVEAFLRDRFPQQVEALFSSEEVRADLEGRNPSQCQKHNISLLIGLCRISSIHRKSSKRLVL